MQHPPVEVTPHLFQLGTKSFPVYLSMGDNGMIIEGGTGPTFDIITTQIESLDIDPQKINYIALTHTHTDHVGAIPRFRQIWPHIQVIGGEMAEKFLKKDRFVKEFLPADKMIADLLLEKGDIPQAPEALEAYPFQVDQVIPENGTIDLGNGIRWRVFYTPGHSPCHVSLFEEKEASLAIGDMTGYYDPEIDVFWPNYFQSLEAYCQSIQKLTDIAAQRVLLSHNGVIDGDSRVYLKKALKATEAYHHEMIQRLDRGDDPKQICKDKADWIVSIGALATYDILIFLSNLLLKNSEKDRDKQLFTV